LIVEPNLDPNSFLTHCIPTKWRSTFSPIESLIRSTTYIQMITVIVGKLHKR
jgi:hypothetical protein